MTRFTRLLCEDGLLVISTAVPAARAEARTLLRAATQNAVAQWLALDGAQIAISSQPGSAPQLRVAGRAAGLSFSHEDGIALAAVYLHGAAGIDVMRVTEVPEWQPLARDYLGPQAAAALAACPASERALALAQAWTAREAALKRAGLPLAEWAGPAPPCRLLALVMPAGLAATLAC